MSRGIPLALTLLVVALPLAARGDDLAKAKERLHGTWALGGKRGHSSFSSHTRRGRPGAEDRPCPGSAARLGTSVGYDPVEVQK
jgi:hypothetical protein